MLAQSSLFLFMDFNPPPIFIGEKRKISSLQRKLVANLEMDGSFIIPVFVCLICAAEHFESGQYLNGQDPKHILFYGTINLYVLKKSLRTLKVSPKKITSNERGCEFHFA